MSLIITLTGMSTSGKSTLAKTLSQSVNFQEAVSVTTRQIRPGEINGVDYHFISNDQFDQYVQQGALLEHVRSHHAAYGVPAFEVENILAQGKSPVLVLEPMGVQAIHRVAQERDYNFLSVYVHTDMLTIMDRFLKRIHGQLELGKEVNYSQEAKRLHTMLNVEKQWAHVWPWDMTLINLHQENGLEFALNDFEGYHQQSSLFCAMPGASLDLGAHKGEKSIEELEKTIRLVIGNGYDASFFHNKLIESSNSNSAKHKMVDIEPSL
jgi:guanylate kinase